MATPTLVQYSTFAFSAENTTTLRNDPLPNIVLSGNAIIRFFQCDSAQTPTFSDDKLNTYTVVANTVGAHGQRAGWAYCLNVTNGPRIMKTTFSPANDYFAETVYEYQNIPTSSAVDTSHGTSGTSATPTPGSMTTGSDGCLILSGFVREDAVGKIVSIAAASGYSLLSADIEDALGVMTKIQSTAGAINDAFTLDTSYGWICVQVAFKPSVASQGTAPSITPRVIGIHHQAINRAGTGASETFQSPMGNGGDFVYGSFIGVSGDVGGTVTSSPSNTWTATAANLVNGGSGNCRGYYVKAPSLSAAMTVTINYTGNGAPPGDTFMMYECIGIHQTTPWVNDANHHQSATGNAVAGTFNGPSITPATSGGLLFNTAGITSNTVVSTDDKYFITSTDPNQEVSPWHADENNAWLVVRNANTSAAQVVYTCDAAADTWAAFADFFDAASGSDTLFAQSWM